MKKPNTTNSRKSGANNRLPKKAVGKNKVLCCKTRVLTLEAIMNRLSLLKSIAVLCLALPTMAKADVCLLSSANSYPYFVDLKEDKNYSRRLTKNDLSTEESRKKNQVEYADKVYFFGRYISGKEAAAGSRVYGGDYLYLDLPEGIRSVYGKKLIIAQSDEASDQAARAHFQRDIIPLEGRASTIQGKLVYERPAAHLKFWIRCSHEPDAEISRKRWFIKPVNQPFYTVLPKSGKGRVYEQLMLPDSPHWKEGQTVTLTGRAATHKIENDYFYIPVILFTPER